MTVEIIVVKGGNNFVSCFQKSQLVITLKNISSKRIKMVDVIQDIDLVTSVSSLGSISGLDC